MERIGSIWTMIVRYLLLVMFGGVIVWACNSAGISVYADDGETPDGAELIRFDFHKSVNQEVGIPAGIPGFFTYFYEGKDISESEDLPKYYTLNTPEKTIKDKM